MPVSGCGGNALSLSWSFALVPVVELRGGVWVRGSQGVVGGGGASRGCGLHNLGIIRG